MAVFTIVVEIIESEPKQWTNQLTLSFLCPNLMFFCIFLRTNRSDTPLIYKAVPSWFVRVEHMVEKLLDNNGKCYW